MLVEERAKRHRKATISHLLTKPREVPNSGVQCHVNSRVKCHDLDERCGAVTTLDSTVHVAEKVAARVFAGKLQAAAEGGLPCQLQHAGVLC